MTSPEAPEALDAPASVGACEAADPEPAGEDAPTLELVEPVPPKACDEDTSSRFKRRSGLPSEEAQLHHDLAVAFVQMQAYQRALDELERLRHDPQREVDALALMATCRRALGRPRSAVLHLEEALEICGDGAYQAIPLRYELGEAWLEVGDRDAALAAFRRVAREGPGFRDVEAKIGSIESATDGA